MNDYFFRELKDEIIKVQKSNKIHLDCIYKKINDHTEEIKKFSQKQDVLNQYLENTQRQVEDQKSIIEKQAKEIYKNNESLDEIFVFLGGLKNCKEEDEKSESEQTAEYVISWLIELMKEGKITQEDGLNQLKKAVKFVNETW